ncbi:MAG: hypothetical protein IH881_04770 [Myxococcales bacterium]|nr:hypothetical protein [Myxococcales bacterium]MCH7866986.1 hypothetical protein [Myxococcales bacterium]
MDVPDSIPIPVQPEPQKNLIPAAVKRSEPPIFDPERDGSGEGHRKKRRTRRDPTATSHEHEPENQDPAGEPDRGSRINIRA